METKQSKRQDLYTSFHKLLRSRLFEASVRLGRMDFAEQDAEQTLAFVDETLELLTEHAEHEDRFVHRLLHAYAGPLARELDQEHAAIEESMTAIRETVAEIPRLFPVDRALRGRDLYARFNALVAAQVAHMGREEREANAVLWAYLTDHEIAGVRQAIVASQTPARTAWIMERMLPLWSLGERAGMLREARAGAPPPVAEMLRRVGEKALGTEGWAQVERAAGGVAQ
jgi:hypothetical protein